MWRDIVHYASAVFMLIFGSVLCVLSLYIPPKGVIDGSVLWVLGQCIIFAASIYGVKQYIDYKLEK